jgi:hypothetical protein
LTQLLRKQRAVYNAIFLIVFLAISISISLCHTDSELGADSSCPACCFQSCSVAIDVIDFYHQPKLVSLETTCQEEFIVHSALIIVEFPGRSPPAF